MARGRRRRGGITGRELLSYARPRTIDESLTDITSNGDMPRGRGGITRRVGLSYAPNRTTNEILDDLTSNGYMPRGRGWNTQKGGLSNAPQGTGDEIVSDSTSNGNGNETSRENVVVTNSGSRSTIESSQNFLENSSQCSRVITNIFKERIDDGAFTWRKPATETQVRTAWESKASERYTDFLRYIRRKMIKPIFISEDTWAGFVAYWDTPEYKGKQETNSQNRLKGDGPSTHTGGSVSYREYAKKLETTLKRPPNPFELFVYTHTKNHDKETFIDKKAKTINDNVLRLREAREANHAEGESSQPVNESALYYEAVGGVKKRNVYGLGSQAFAYYPNPANRSSATYMPHVPLENKYLEMERKLTHKIGKQQQILELLCSHLDIPVPSTESDIEDNNEADIVGGTQNPNTSNSEEHEV
ncbi:PDR ABC-type transporter family protein [Tanacetum coccineum]|uniref:PDR ABC-type transporter family protein n=1 Tax=Tanacetum coccineum TaxID=301880 RepID=A0ABQ5E275_9ASTR